MAGGPRRGAGGPGRLTLVVLGGGPAQRHAIEAAARLGVRTIVCDAVPGRGDVRVSSEDLAGVRGVARGADGIIAPGTDWPVRVAAQVAHELRLPHPIGVETALAATDKLLQRARFTAAGVPQPEWSEVGPPGLPCVVKAPDRQGQRAMTVVRRHAELSGAVARARQGSRSGRVLFERLVPGPELTVNGFSLGGRFHAVAVTDRVHFPDAFGVARRHVCPALRGSAEAACAAGAAVSALAIEEGPSYVQLVLGADGPRVIEVAARLGGGHDSELVRAVTGADLAGASVRAALGLPVDAATVTAKPQGAGVIEFFAAPPGRLLRARVPPGVTLYHGPDHVYEPLRTGPDRAGYVLATGQTRRQALARARAAVARVRLEVA